MGYKSKYKGAEVDAALDLAKSALQEHQDISGKQDKLVSGTNIKTINGVDILNSGDLELATKQELDNKVDKVSGKQLSTEDFTTVLLNKLNGLSNYDDTAIQSAVSNLQTQLNTLVSGDANAAIESFNEIIAFLEGVEDTQTLDGIIAGIEQQIATKMDNVVLATVATSGSYNDLSNKPTIPSAVTEGTVSGWGFTKNTGTYSKPSNGIPKTDLESSVQSSLSKADTALQSYTETDPTVPSWAKAASKPTYTASEVGAVPTTRKVNGKALSSDITLSASDVSALPSTTVIPTKVSQLTNDSNFTSNTGTITGITMNGTSKGTSGVVNLGTVITSHQDISGKQDKLVSGTNIKTINGTSLLGSGNIEAGSSTIDTFQTRTGTTHGISSFAANTVFSCSSPGNTTHITISGFANPTPATRAAYYTIVFKATSCTFTVPSTVMWVGGNAIEFDSSTAYTYEVNFMKIQLSAGVRYLATWNRY